MWQNDETKYNKQICFQSAMFMFKVMFRMLRNPNEATPKSVLWKKSLKLDVLKWMAILGVEGVKGAAENKTCVICADPDTLLNKRTELISTCRNRNKFPLANVKK